MSFVCGTQPRATHLFPCNKGWSAPLVRQSVPQCMRMPLAAPDVFLLAVKVQKRRRQRTRRRSQVTVIIPNVPRPEPDPALFASAFVVVIPGMGLWST